MTELLLDTMLDDTQRDYAETVRQSADRLLASIEDILDVSQIESGKMRCEAGVFDIHKTIESAVEMLAERARRKNIEIALAIDESVPQTLCGDSGRLRQVLTNLVGNAVKFTERGNVRVEVRTEKEIDQQLTLRFDVIDTGIGIDKKNLKKLFQPFVQVDDSTTRQYGGTGLGLTISKQIVELMSGEIMIESQPEKGSCFSFTACFDRPPATESGDRAAAPAVSAPPVREAVLKSEAVKTDRKKPENECGAASSEACHSQRAARVEKKAGFFQRGEGPLRILVVEDNEVNQFVVLSQLEKIGISADVAVDGIDALEKIAAADYQMVFMDCQMPRLDGYQAAKEIRRLEALKKERGEVFKPLTIIALTAHTIAGEREKCLAAGMNDFLTKPLKANELAAFFPDPNAKIASEENRLSNLAQSTTPPDDDGAPSTEKNEAFPPSPYLLTASANFNNLSDNFSAEIINIYFTDTARQIAEISQSIKNNEIASVARVAHAVRGNSLAIGVLEIAAAAAALEEHSIKNEPEEISFYFERLSEEFSLLGKTAKA
jgi:CheY-like chemotaxis protein/anti-sigma regulatory factor (Ser/Thr protein kinase)